MSDNMADGSNVGIIVSIGGAIGTVITLLKFWTWFSDRITDADKKADSALQEAAEAKNDVSNLREASDQMVRDMHDEIERMRRERADGLLALQQHVTDLAMFMRDHFVRNDVFAAAMTKLEASQLRMDTKLDRIAEQTRPH
jgi:hypothetical protein